jgi:hypothetical protein
MRGWGKVSICKASIPDHELGIRSTYNLFERGNKVRCGGHRNTYEESRDER